MRPNAFHRLHALRLANDAKGYEMDELRPRFAALATRHEDGTAPRAVSAYNLFQTPPELAARLVALLRVPPCARILEPSAGLGRLLDAMPLQNVVAVEVAPQLCAELYRQAREGVTLMQRDFLTVTPEEIGSFDACAMNPPFHLKADEKHIEHALRFVRTGGTLAALCLDTPHREAALRDRCATWERIPGAFGREGTRVATVLLSMTKP